MHKLYVTGECIDDELVYKSHRATQTRMTLSTIFMCSTTILADENSDMITQRSNQAWDNYTKIVQ